MSLEFIESARVHLALPESSMFRRTSVKPKASVALLVKAGMEVQPDTVRGIQRLVAAAIPELESADVTIVDPRGAAVTGRSAELGFTEDPKLELKIALESHYTKKVMDVLAPIVGKGNAIVSVEANLNFDELRVTQETNDTGASPESPSLLQAVAGAANLNGSIPPSAQKMSGVRIGENTPPSQTSDRSFRRLEQIVASAGSVRRLSVGVLVKSDLEPAKSNQLKAVIGAAIGLNAARGDVLSMFFQPESNSAMVPDASQPESKLAQATPPLIESTAPRSSLSQPLHIAIWAVLLLLALLAVMVASTLVIRARRPGPHHRLSESERASYASRLRHLLNNPGGNLEPPAP